MKQWIALFALALLCSFLPAQKSDPVKLLLAFQEHYAGETHFSGTARWTKLGGESVVGKFVVDGERFHLTWADGELLGDGTYEWEVMHRSKRVKKRFYDPLIAPSVLMAFRFVRLDLEAEPVHIAGTAEEIVIEVDFGSSVTQGNHTIRIDPKALVPLAITMHITQEGYFEMAEIADVRAGELANKDTFTFDFAAWKAKGYSLTDMARGESDAIWPEERALKQ